MTLQISLNVNGREWLPPGEWISDFVASVGAYRESDVEPGMKANNFRLVGSSAASQAPKTSVEVVTPNTAQVSLL